MLVPSADEAECTAKVVRGLDGPSVPVKVTGQPRLPGYIPSADVTGYMGRLPSRVIQPSTTVNPCVGGKVERRYPSLLSCQITSNCFLTGMKKVGVRSYFSLQGLRLH